MEKAVIHISDITSILLFIRFDITFWQFLSTWTALYLPSPFRASYSPPCFPRVCINKLHRQAARSDA